MARHAANRHERLCTIQTGPAPWPRPMHWLWCHSLFRQPLADGFSQFPVDLWRQPEMLRPANTRILEWVSAVSPRVTFTYTCTGKHFGISRYRSILRVEFVSDQIVDSQFDGLFRCHTNQLGHQASVQPQHALVSHDFLETIQRIPVRHFAHQRASSLVLHTRFDQINWIHGRGTKCTSQRTQRETVCTLQHLNEYGTIVRTGHGLVVRQPCGYLLGIMFWRNVVQVAVYYPPTVNNKQRIFIFYLYGRTSRTTT